MSYKLHFLSIFRELFVPHYRSLEFRAKILAAMLIAKKNLVDSDYEDVAQIAKDIYGDDKKRIHILVQTVKEYVDKATQGGELNLDSLLKDIDYELKNIKRYVKKIDFADLRRLMINSDEVDAHFQQQVYEFFLNEVKIYSNN
ncbi:MULTISPECIES: hypothetical protein [Campylobacter]|uniref:Uncharacterized protein n=1 Tax=Campylobacter vicugnae TaxID=1660076 RepID=A0ABZ2E7T1_9BACT|nr:MULTISPECIES: hypothetical protein [Campylobacter]MCR8690662.1 hypothetical protein [Campylobacter sp. RM9264]MCR8701808.1 hypothetical protein [Campylobacter sp. RM12176]ARR03181.1 hypothetical protein CVIC12175_0006 [Campylobacter sp. RM12175]MBE6430385.1 hypothetical protein [Campylobacter sp.]MBO5063546.1 hypothetical protein [Campylobacter sp.]